MKEGASNCVERHLNLNDCETSLLWAYSEVGHKCCFHSQRITPRAARKRAYVRIYAALARGDSKLPHRPANRSRLLGGSCEVRPCPAPRK